MSFIIYCSKYGWDHVIQGLVHLGFLLMDSFGPKAIFGRIETSAVPQTGPTHLACQLGSQILLNTFKVLLDNILKWKYTTCFQRNIST